MRPASVVEGMECSLSMKTIDLALKLVGCTDLALRLVGHTVCDDLH